MATYTYKTKGVCSKSITVELEGRTIKRVAFTGGCDGNLKAISKLVDGWTVDKIEEYLKGNTCGRKPTSCADQLAIGVRLAHDKEAAEKQA